MNDPIYLLDRSGAETDDICGMRFWYERLEGNRGIVPIKKPDYLTEGIDTHEDLAMIAGLDDIMKGAIENVVQSIIASNPDADKEPLYRRVGWLAAFALFVEPKIRATYETLQVEHEIILDRSPLWIPVTPDRVLRHREDKYLCYKEYKTTITAGPKWMASWPFQIQPHIGMKAIEEELHEPVAFTQIVGLLKGDRRGDRLAHPYVWGYRNKETGAWTHDYNKARSSNWDHAPVWEYPDGPVAWVELLGEDLAVSQFPHSAPVFLNNRMLDNWVARKIARMNEIHYSLDECRSDENIRRLYFEQRTRACAPAFGDPCPYRAACWNAAISAAPLASGLYEERVPHHEVEINALREQGRI